jgi:macrolide transport system ATP-binding/permease protein
MIRLEGVTKRYRLGETEVQALRGLDLKIREGEFLAIMGPSGSGKSTLLHLLGCLDLPTEGRVHLGDIDVGGLREDALAEVRGKKIGFVFQTFNLIPTLTALENVELSLFFQGVARGERRRRAQALLERVGLGDRLHHRPAQLSGGERQRVAIARALANDPEVILADEPTGNLDSEAGRQILELLQDLNREGRTIILVTHNPEAAAYAERVVHLRDGRIVREERHNHSQSPPPPLGTPPSQGGPPEPQRRTAPAAWLDSWRLALRSLSHRPKRSWLTIIGILIGIMAVVALISLGQGIQRAVDKQFEAFGYNIVTITPASARGFRGFAGTAFEFEDTTLRSAPGVEAVGVMLFKNAYIQTEKLEGFLPVLGLSAEMMRTFRGYDPEVGRILQEGDRLAAVLGREVAEDLGLQGGDRLRVEDREFEVVGILKKSPNPQTNDGIFVPLETLREIFGEAGKVSFVLVRVADGYDAKEVAEDLKERLKESRGKDDLRVQTLEQIRETIGGVIAAVQAFLGGIAAISLLVGGIGVMNTMYTAVLERTREIGVMKAVGARRRQILGLFLIESGLMGLVGGALGTLLGIGLSAGAVAVGQRLVPDANLFELVVSPELIVGALLFSFLLGALAGVLPARGAAKLPPVEALRYE